MQENIDDNKENIDDNKQNIDDMQENIDSLGSGTILLLLIISTEF